MTVMKRILLLAIVGSGLWSTDRMLAQTPSPPPPVLSTQASPPIGAMPEPAQMSGYALQVGDLPPGIVAVRVIRQSFASNMPGRTVLLRVGDSGRVLGAVTNAEGRVQFDGLQVGEWVRVRAAAEGETLESQRFQVPAQGGVRMVLVAGVGAAQASASDVWPASESIAPVASGIQGPAVPSTLPAARATVPIANASGISWLWSFGFGTATILFVVYLVLRRRS